MIEVLNQMERPPLLSLGKLSHQSADLTMIGQKGKQMNTPIALLN